MQMRDAEDTYVVTGSLFTYNKNLRTVTASVIGCRITVADMIILTRRISGQNTQNISSYCKLSILEKYVAFIFVYSHFSIYITDGALNNIA
jgi:hypothetical protein